MAQYIDTIVSPVRTKHMDRYVKMAKLSAKIWKEHGAVAYVECVADDVQKGKTTSFPQSLKLKAGETVSIAVVTYKSRGHRDRVMAKVMKDPRVEAMMSEEPMPFDMERMFWGGFKPVANA